MNLKDTIKTIDILENINENDDYAYENAVLAYLKLGGLPIFIYELPSGENFYHTRTHKTNDLFLKVSEIFIPPKNCVKDFARCNRPFQSVFYCSENIPTSYHELLEYWADTKKIGEKLFVTYGLWKVKKVINTIIVTSPNVSERFSDFDKKHGVYFDREMLKYKGEELEAQKLFYSFLFEKFRKPAKKDLKTYIITSSYCNVAFMHANGQADAIYYPSVPYKGKGINISFNKDFFNYDNLELISATCDEFKISKNNEEKHSFDEISRFESKEINFEDNLIIWDNKSLF